MAPKIPDGWVRRPIRDSVRIVTLPYNTVLKPFHQTRLGRLPPELREQIFLELLATPSPYAGHDFAINSSRSKTSPRASQKFVHIKESWYHVTRTCRQIYLEAHPLFFASKAYFLASAEDTRLFLPGFPSPPHFRFDTITTLCLKDLVERSARYSKEAIDEIISDPTNFFGRIYTRQELEAQTRNRIEASVFMPLRRIKNLKTVGLCFAVGEEMEYIDFLFGLTGLTTGLVEFPDAQHWMIRPQNAKDVWRTQYAGFFNSSWGLDENGEPIPFNLFLNERDIAAIDSRAPGLQEGDQRYVEVQIQCLAGYLYGYESEIGRESASSVSGVDTQDSVEAQLESAQDPLDLFEGIEATALAETSEEDISMPALDPESNQIKQSSVLELQRKAIPELTPDSNTDEGDDNSAIDSASEEVPSTQPETQSNHHAEDHLLSRPLESVTYNAPADTENDRESLLDRDEEDDRVQTNTKPRDQTPKRMISQDNYEFYGDSATESDLQQNTIKEKRKGGVRRAKLRQAFSQKKQPLLDIVVTPSPYTEEEMEPHEKWQQQAIWANPKQTMKTFRQKEKPSTPFRKKQWQNGKNSGGATQTVTAGETSLSPASPNPSGLLSKSIQMGGAFVLVLLLVILSLPSKTVSNAGQEGKGSYQQ